MKQILLRSEKELKKYVSIEKFKNTIEVIFSFNDSVKIDFESDGLKWFDYAKVNEDEDDCKHKLIFKCKDIEFTKSFKIDEIYAENVVSNNTLLANNISATNDIQGYDIRLSSIKARNINTKFLVCQNLDCSNCLKADILLFNNQVFEKIKAYHIKKTEERKDHD